MFDRHYSLELDQLLNNYSTFEQDNDIIIYTQMF